MSVIFSTQDKYVNMDKDGCSEDTITPMPSTSSSAQPSSAMVKKSTMYIIVALSVVVTSLMFAITVTLVYLIAKEGKTSSEGGNTAGSRGAPDNLSPNYQGYVQSSTQKPSKKVDASKRKSILLFKFVIQLYNSPYLY